MKISYLFFASILFFSCKKEDTETKDNNWCGTTTDSKGKIATVKTLDVTNIIKYNDTLYPSHIINYNGTTYDTASLKIENGFISNSYYLSYKNKSDVSLFSLSRSNINNFFSLADNYYFLDEAFSNEIIGKNFNGHQFSQLDVDFYSYIYLPEYKYPQTKFSEYFYGPLGEILIDSNNVIEFTTIPNNLELVYDIYRGYNKIPMISFLINSPEEYLIKSIKRYTDLGTISKNYTYEFDSYNRLTKIIENNDGFIYTIEYTYW